MRKYLPTLAELIDRLSIVLLKSVFIEKNHEAYLEEIQLIEHDINDIINEWHGAGHNFTAYDLRMVMVTMLANREIWLNESTVREEGVGFERLRYTHSINGVRNTAKNNLSAVFGDRKDLKVDCLAADLPGDYGNWDVFG